MKRERSEVGSNSVTRSPSADRHTRSLWSPLSEARMPAAPAGRFGMSPIGRDGRPRSTWAETCPEIGLPSAMARSVDAISWSVAMGAR